MPLRDFDSAAQTATWQRMDTFASITWVELACPACETSSYVAMKKPLNRIGSQRQFAVCRGCGQHLVGGAIKCWPKVRTPLLHRILPWLSNHDRGGGWTMLKDNTRKRRR